VVTARLPGSPGSLTVHLVPDEACPRCGASWGNLDPDLDFPNRPKVTDDMGEHWKCYNPNCTAAFYIPGYGVTENKLSPEAEEEMRARISADMDAMMAGKVWITKLLPATDSDDGPGMSTSMMIPEGDEVPEGWKLLSAKAISSGPAD